MATFNKPFAGQEMASIAFLSRELKNLSGAFPLRFRFPEADHNRHLQQPLNRLLFTIPDIL
jgi:hypothetical protein